MFSHLLSISALAALASASPIVYPRDTSPYVFTNSNGLNFTQMNATLPNITVFATGILLLFPSYLAKQVC